MFPLLKMLITICSGILLIILSPWIGVVNLVGVVSLTGVVNMIRVMIWSRHSIYIPIMRIPVLAISSRVCMCFILMTRVPISTSVEIPLGLSRIQLCHVMGVYRGLCSLYS